ncbi:hypothetical protein F5897_000701 [Canibacter oris]|uniref:Uncharacterized protein n=1 Tax=Canibacter oris TaxID=1365628 RepID=A0A840DMX3_9MICO|nr:hypothetical protein [Canibacter oris]
MRLFCHDRILIKIPRLPQRLGAHACFNKSYQAPELSIHSSSKFRVVYSYPAIQPATAIKVAAHAVDG